MQTKTLLLLDRFLKEVKENVGNTIDVVHLLAEYECDFTEIKL